MANNCHYCNDPDCPELDWRYGLDHILPDYAFCPMCGRRMDGGSIPLTLDELREMVWEPIWTCSANKHIDHVIHGWTMVMYSPEKDSFWIQQIGGITTEYEAEGYGKYWLAYRRKPKGVKSQ